jgi:hypothetical protein
VVALIAYMIYKSSKDKKAKKEKEAEAKKKNEENALKKSQDDAAYTSAKTQYDAVRGEYEARCGHYPDGYQTWAITPEGASKSEKTSAMSTKGAELASAPCKTSSSESEAVAH